MRSSQAKSSWVIGGTTLVGAGIGFVLLQTSALLFLASILIGVGAGLIITSVLPNP